MWPTVCSGDIVHISPNKQIAVGDIVLYARDELWCLHRVIRQEAGRDLFVTRGDAFATDDPPADRGDILGKAISLERGDLRIPLCGPIGRAYLALTGLALVRNFVRLLRRRLPSRFKDLLKTLLGTNRRDRSGAPSSH